MNTIWIPQILACGMLLWALNPGNPYGYYVLLRWVCCGIFVYLTVQAAIRQKQGIAWTLGVTALIYNPILRIHMTREIWSVVNIITIAIVGISVFALGAKRKGDPSSNSPEETD